MLVDLWLKNSSKQGIDIIYELKNNFTNLVIISFSGHANIDSTMNLLRQELMTLLKNHLKQKNFFILFKKIFWN